MVKLVNFILKRYHLLLEVLTSILLLCPQFLFYIALKSRDHIIIFSIEVSLVRLKLINNFIKIAFNSGVGAQIVLKIVQSLEIFIAALECWEKFRIIDRNTFANRTNTTDEDTSIFCSWNEEGIIWCDSHLCYSCSMKMQLCEMLCKFHWICKRPLMSSDFSCRGSHEDCSHFINYQKLGDVVRICPHNCKLLSSSFSVKLCDRLRITDSHDVKNGIICRSEAFICFVPDLKYSISFTCHDHGATIGK